MGMLSGKVAVVTGAGEGIGRSEALTLAAHGAAVVVNDLGSGAPGDAAQAVVGEIVDSGGRAVAHHADVSDWDAGIVERAVQEFGRLDILVTNAGIVRRGPIIDVTEQDLDAQMGVLFKGTFAVLHHAARHWRDRHEAGDRERRNVIATSSSAGIPGGVQEFSVYGAMKAAIATLALGAALELRPYGVSINVILPHAATAMDAQAKGIAAPPRFDPQDMDRDNPQHVANVVTWLASPSSSWLSGQVFEITGTNVRRWRQWAAHLEIDNSEQWTPESLDEAMATTMFGTLPGGRIIPSGH